MLRKTILALCSLGLIAAAFAARGAAPAQAQAEPELRLITEFQVPGSDYVKFPGVVAANDVVYVSGNANRETAYVWSKAATATRFDTPFELGPAEGQPDFSSTSVARGANGAIYAAWINQESRTIYLRVRDTGGVWGPTRTVGRSGFPVKPAVGVNSNNQIFVAWRDPDAPIRYRYSTDGGASWASTSNVSDNPAYDSQITLAGGPNGAMGITYTAGEGDRLQIFVGLWNGSSFSVQRVTPTSGDFADSSMSIGPDGKIYVAWRGVAESGGNSGIFYAERATDGGWPRSRLTGTKATGNVSVNADESGNVHFTWVALPSGGNQVYYAFKPANDAPRGPIGSSERGALFNARGFGSTATGTYSHAVAESFNGSRLHTHYAVFQATGTGFGGDPVVENDAARTFRNAESTVQVSFRNVLGSPNQVRFAWNRPPNDSDQWQTFATTMRVAVPESIYTSTTCEISTLYSQLRNTSTNQFQSQPRSDTVLIDGVVEVAVSIDNPVSHIAGAQLNGLEGAPGGDPSYTRLPLVYLNVVPLSDCTGLTSLGVGATPTTVETFYPVTAAGFAGTVALPNLAGVVPGQETTFYVRVVDGAGNARVFPFKVILDEEDPVLNTENPGQVSAAANPVSDLIQDLTFTNLNIRDETYREVGDPDPNRRFWGFWIANSTDPIEDPVNDPGLKWSVADAPLSVAVPNTNTGGTDYKVTLKNWSLATGLTKAQLTPGDFYIYVRFLDGAGNPTDGYLAVRVEASQLQSLKTILPMNNR